MKLRWAPRQDAASYVGTREHPGSRYGASGRGWF